MTANIIAFIWGFAEATLFFIVPDVGISFIALNGYTAGLQASVSALTGALLGGGIMYVWGRADLEAVVRIFCRIPAIRRMDIEKVRSDLKKSGGVAMFWGPILGIPYKIYAAHAHLFTSLFVFLLISVPARMVRFVLVAVVTPYLMDKVAPGTSLVSRIQIVLFLWSVLYAVYFYVKSRR